LLFFAFVYLRLFFRIETFQCVMADTNRNFLLSRLAPVLVAKQGAKLVTVEFVITETIALVSSLRKKMSPNFWNPSRSPAKPSSIIAQVEHSGAAPPDDGDREGRAFSGLRGRSDRWRLGH
jgi:hypothetical protein